MALLLIMLKTIKNVYTIFVTWSWSWSFPNVHFNRFDLAKGDPFSLPHFECRHPYVRLVTCRAHHIFINGLFEHNTKVIWIFQKVNLEVLESHFRMWRTRREKREFCLNNHYTIDLVVDVLLLLSLLSVPVLDIILTVQLSPHSYLHFQVIYWNFFFPSVCFAILTSICKKEQKKNYDARKVRVKQEMDFFLVRTFFSRIRRFIWFDPWWNINIEYGKEWNLISQI